jgi:hypothetical protein
MGFLQVNDSAELREIVARHRQLVQMRTVEGNHLAHATSDTIRKSINAILKTVEEQIDVLDNGMAQRIQDSP